MHRSLCRLARRRQPAVSALLGAHILLACALRFLFWTIGLSVTDIAQDRLHTFVARAPCATKRHEPHPDCKRTVRLVPWRGLLREEVNTFNVPEAGLSTRHHATGKDYEPESELL